MVHGCLGEHVHQGGGHVHPHGGHAHHHSQQVHHADVSFVQLYYWVKNRLTIS